MESFNSSLKVTAIKRLQGILNISVHTVEKRRAAAMHKLGLTSVADVTRYAIRNKIAEG